jgi:hypothetical protein
MAKFLELEDVEKAAALYPETFFIPGKAEREGQNAGDSVRLHFLLQDGGPNEPRAERIWVTITQAEGGGTYKGTLQTAPIFFNELKIDDEVAFGPRHIARTIIKKDDPRWIDSSELRALVSKMCLEKGNGVRFLYREAADRSEDSGWRMFSGNEPEGYCDIASNVRLINVGYMLDRDSTLLEPLKAGTGAVFERENLGDAWQKVTDWEPSGD